MESADPAREPGADEACLNSMSRTKKYLAGLHVMIPVLLLILPACEGRGQEMKPDAGSKSPGSAHERKPLMTWKKVLDYASNGSPAPDRRVEKSEDEWRKLLTREQYQITRAKGTERPYSGEYCSAHEPGLYACVGCKTVLFDSREKFESGTGWPSFTQPAAPNVITYIQDNSYGMERIEVQCSVCDAHLGHVFPDGPGKGGLRYCINSASLVRLPGD